MSLPYAWGVSGDEASRAYPADDLVGSPVVTMTRAVDVAAPVELTWRWLCQIAVAPYSYDWIDNRGRRSPRTLTPGADDLVLGQRIGVVFDLVSFEAPYQWTGLTRPSAQRPFGPVALTYAAEPAGSGSRLIGRLALQRGGVAGRVRAQLLGWGDLVMMRKQLLTLAGLAERDAQAH